MTNGDSKTTPWRAQALAASLFLVLATDMFILSPLLPQLSAEFGVTPGRASVLAWSFALVYAVLSPMVALISNRLTRRGAMWVGATVFSVGALATGLLPTLELIVVARVVTAVGAAIMGPPVWSFASETAAPHEVGRAVARVASTFAAGQIIGIPLGSLVADVGSWRWVFLGLGVCGGVIAILIACRLGPEARIPERTGLRTAAGRSIRLWADTRFRLLLVSNFFAQATRYATYTFAGALLFMRFGLDTAELGLIGMAVGAGSLIGSMIGGFVVDRVRARGGSQAMINVAAATIMTACIIAATASDIFIVALAGWVCAFGAGSAFVSNGQEMLTSAAGVNRTYALSWNNSALYAGTAAGTVILGAVQLGSVAFAIVAGSLGLIAAIGSLLMWAHERKAPYTDAVPQA